MKKYLKITGIIVIFMALVVFWGYNKFFTPNPEIEQQLNSQFGAVFFTSFDEVSATNNSGTVNDAKSVDSENKLDTSMLESMVEKAKDPEAGKNATASTYVNEGTVGKPIQDEINNKYKRQFDYLENVALSRLDTLYSAAVQEYRQGNKAGTLKRSELVQKYIQAGTMLEANVDSQFYSALNMMQAELIENNLPTDIISTKKSEYGNVKSSMRSQLLGKAGL
ncbi:hypothetical protein [Desulfosporosinus fructosivorans]